MPATAKYCGSHVGFGRALVNMATLAGDESGDG